MDLVKRLVPPVSSGCHSSRTQRRRERGPDQTELSGVGPVQLIATRSGLDELALDEHSGREVHSASW